MELPAALPVVIATPEPPGFVRTAQAHWNDLQRSLRAQEDLIDSLVTEVGDYAETLDRLRPYMADHPFRTVADALELMEARK